MACLNAQTTLVNWNPGAGPAGSVVLIIGSSAAPGFALSAHVVEDGKIKVGGGLNTTAEVTAFKNSVKAKVNARQPPKPFRFIDYRVNIVVPCPPPVAPLSLADRAALDPIAQAVGVTVDQLVAP